ncbi:hypothetical protein GCM10023091_19750 [Ravibacter arvi]|uniref:DUF1549 domain-containing protein n=2 Tax=Ravibacter arvi TaxID=2051041 RepID=A0ABP8LYH3_9BACT
MTGKNLTNPALIDIMTPSDPFWLWQLLGRLHPLVVHFPIGLLCAALLLELLALKKRENPYRPALNVLLWAGTLSALLAVIFGWMLAGQEESEGLRLEIHRWTGIATFGLSAASLWGFTKRNVSLYRALLALTVGGVTVAGHYGATLTHGEDYISGVLPFNRASNQENAATVPISLAAFGETLTPQQVEDLNLQVRTILAHNCYNCHGEAKKKGGLRLDSKDAVFAGGENGPVVVPGKSGKSELIRRITLPAGHKEIMPSKGKLLSGDEINVLKLWIDRGAPWPEGKEKSIYRVAALEPRLPKIPDATAGFTTPIDRFVNAYFNTHQVKWPELVDDKTYIRRVYLDAIGLLPTPEAIAEFEASTAPDKREVLVKTLLKRDDDYAQHWLTFWNDVLRNDYSGTGYITGGRFDITRWLYASLRDNKPYNWFVKELISPEKASEGFIKGIKWRGTINSSQSTQMQAAQNVAQVFLGLNLKCASCHDSFISDWKLEDAYGFANIFADSTLEIHRCDQPTGKMAKSKMLFSELGEISADARPDQRLKELAEFLTQPKDGRLYRTLVNRMWAQLMGRGIVEPVDVMDNLPWSEDLLDWLAYDFAENGYDTRRLLFQIMTSKTYQMPSVSIDDAGKLVAENFKFTGMVRRRLSAEQFADAISLTFHPVYPDSAMALKRLPEDIRKKMPFPRASLVINDRFMTALGRPNRETVSTSRMTQANLLQALELTNGTTFYETLKAGSKEWKRRYPTSDGLINELYLKAYGRLPEKRELEAAEKALGKVPDEAGIQDLVWAIALSPEFQLIL